MRINVHAYTQTSAKCIINKKLRMTQFKLSCDINWFYRLSGEKNSSSGWKPIRYFGNKTLEIQHKKAPNAYNPEGNTRKAEFCVIGTKLES